MQVQTPLHVSLKREFKYSFDRMDIIMKEEVYESR